MEVRNVFGRDIESGSRVYPSAAPSSAGAAPVIDPTAPAKTIIRDIRTIFGSSDREEWLDGDVPDSAACRRIRRNSWKLVVELTLCDDGTVLQTVRVDKRRRHQILSDPDLVPLSGWFTELRYRRIPVFMRTTSFKVCVPDKNRGECIAPATELYLWSLSDAVEQFLAAMRLKRHEGSTLDLKQLMLIGGVTLFVIICIWYWV